MITPQLLSYIKIQLQKNIAPEEIKKTLLANGWQQIDIDEGFRRATAVTSEAVIKPAPPIQPTQIIQPVQIVATKKSSNKLLIFLAVTVLMFVLGAVGAFAYFYLLIPKLTPDQVLMKTLSNLSSLKSLEYAGDLKLSFNSAEVLRAGKSIASSSNLMMASASTTIDQEKGELTISFNGSSDLQTISDPRSSFLFNISASTLGLVGTSTDKFNFGLELRNLGQVVYLKLNDAPDIGFFDLAPIKGQWIKVDFDSIGKQIGLDKMQSEIENQASSSIKQPTIEQLNQIRDVLVKRQIVKVGEVLADEKIGDIDTYHYRLTIDQAEIKQAIIEIIPIVRGNSLSGDELQKFDQGLTSTEIPNVEVWIGKKDLYPYKLLLNSIIKNSAKSAELGQVTLAINFKNFNQPISVVAPDSFKTLQELMAEMFKVSTSTTVLKKK